MRDATHHGLGWRDGVSFVGLLIAAAGVVLSPVWVLLILVGVAVIGLGILL